MLNDWHKFYFHQILGSQKLFLRAFHNLTNHQLLQLRHKFDILPDYWANQQEFPSTIILSHLLLQSAYGKDFIEDENLARYLAAMAEMQPQYEQQVRNLVLINREIDSFYQHHIDWSSFSNHVMQSANRQKAASLTNYFNSQTMHQLTSSKVKDPMQSVSYSRESDSFLVCLKDNAVVQVDKSGSILGRIKTYAMPVSAATFRPHIDNYMSYGFDLKPQCGGYNTIVSTTDRKLNIYNGSQLLSSIPTDNMHTVVTTHDRVYYRRYIVYPAIFSGDNEGNVCFWKLNDQQLDGDDKIELGELKVLAEEEDLDFSSDATVDQQEQIQDTEVAHEDIRQRFDEYKQYYELLYKSYVLATRQHLSPTPIWSLNAHKAWVNAVLLEYMQNSGYYILASGAADGSICTYDINTGQRAATFSGHENVQSLAWLHSRGLLVSVGSDRRLNVYVPGSTQSKTAVMQAPIAQLPPADHAYIGVFSAPDKPEFITVDTMGTVRYWDIRKLQPIATIFGQPQRNGKTVSAAYADSGHVALGAGYFCLAHPQNAGRQLQICQNAIECVALPPCCPSIALAAGDTIFVWDLRSGRCAHQITDFGFRGKRKLRQKNSTIGTLSGRVDNAEAVGMNVLQAMADPRSSDKTGCIDLAAVEIRAVESADEKALRTSGSRKDAPASAEKYGNPALAAQGTVETRRETTAIGLSPNGGIIAVATDDERIVILSTQSQQIIWEFQPSNEEEKEINSALKEKYEQMQQMQQRYNKIQAQLEFTDMQPQIDKAQAVYDALDVRIGVCTDLFFHEGPSYLGYWQCFREQRKIVTYKIINKEERLLNARATFRGAWVYSLFHYLYGQLILRGDTEITVVMFDGAPLCRMSFSYRLKVADLDESILAIVMDCRDLVIFIDFDTMNVFAWAEIPGISRTQSFRLASSQESLLFLSEENTLLTYHVELTAVRQRFSKMKFTTNNIDIHIPLSQAYKINGISYSFSFNTRRSSFVITEIPEKQRGEFGANALLDYPVQLETQPLQIVSYADGVNLSDVCLLYVYYHYLAGIFVVTTALGYVLAVSAQSGQFVQFLTLNGWQYQAKSMMLHLEKRIEPTRYLQKIVQEDIRNYEQAKQFSTDLALKISGAQVPEREIENAQLRSRRKNSILELSKQFQQDVEHFNAKKIQFMKTDANLSSIIKEGNQRMHRYYIESFDTLRSKSQLISPVRKLPKLAEDPAAALGRAVSQVRAIKEATDYRWQREVRTVKSNFKSIERKISENKQTRLPTILNMTRAELIQKYGSAEDKDQVAK